MNFVFDSIEDVKPKVKNEIWLQSIDDVMCDGSHNSKIKDSSGTELNTYVKKEETCNIQIKSEAPDLEYNTDYGDHSIKSETLHEELDIKAEILVNRKDQTFELHHQLEENIFKCSLCSYTSVKQRSFKRHNKTHTSEKPFKCCVCTYATIEKGNLEKHVKTHSGEKPFKCTVCHYACIEKRGLERHIKTHTREKPYTCSICSYASGRKDNLEKHIKTHTDEKPFKCSVCGYACRRKDNLAVHMRTHT